MLHRFDRTKERWARERDRRQARHRLGQGSRQPSPRGKTELRDVFWKEQPAMDGKQDVGLGANFIRRGPRTPDS